YILVIFSFFVTSLATAQTADPADTAWKTGAQFNLQLNQASYSNWQAGGVNSIAGNVLFNAFADYDKGGKWAWFNSVNIAYGLNFQDTIFSKTDDRFEFESRLDRKLTKKWNASALLNFRTQFSNGYETPGIREDTTKISGFLAPAYTLFGLGLTYKPNKKFSAFISPLTLKITSVYDDRLSGMGAFGVDTGSYNRFEVGGYVNIGYKTPLGENIELQSKLDLYSNYLDGNYKFVDVNGEMIIFMKVNDYITASLALNVIYDHDILIDADGDGTADGPRTQFREVLGVGFAYSFGDKRKAQ
ncbi:MAG: DUF3078 domain-containing protein, partial [Owenweeksia sp.]